MVKKRATTIFLLSLTAIALYFCYLIAKPFLKPAVLAGVIAVIFYPLHSRIRTLFRNLHTAALVSTVLVILAIVVPASALGGAFTRELSSLY
jgi:predicted PurR-regulated permease PerM